MTFNIGDEVLFIECSQEKPNNDGYHSEWRGKKVVVTAIAREGENYLVEVRNESGQYCNASRVAPISSVKKTMSTLRTLTKQQKADLSPENRALVELGLLEDNLVPTVKGLEYLQEFLFEQNKAELAKIAVKEVAEIRKEEKTTKGK